MLKIIKGVLYLSSIDSDDSDDSDCVDGNDSDGEYLLCMVIMVFLQILIFKTL